MSKTIKLTFDRAAIDAHIALHKGAVVPLNTDANKWCSENCLLKWKPKRLPGEMNEPVVFEYEFDSERDATLFMMFHAGVSSE